MTTGYVPQEPTNVVVRAWRAFGRWRRGRPFWGGLLLILSGAEFYLSGHLDLTAMHVQIGPEGFLTWVIPLVLVLCGLLLWLTPAQRIFYGVVGAAVAVYGLMGLNLGGFVVGMLLGIIGGSLGAAWTPSVPRTAEGTDVEPQDDGLDGKLPPEEPEEQDATVDEILSGPLTDHLPTSTTSPLAGAPATSRRGGGSPPSDAVTEEIDAVRYPVPPRHAADTTGEPATGARDASPVAGSAGTPGSVEEPPNGAGGGALPRRSPRILGLILVGSITTATAIVAAQSPRPAMAAPCPSVAVTTAKPAPSGHSTTKGTTTGGTTGGTTSAAKPAPAPAAGGTAPSPTPTATAGSGGGNPVASVVNGVLTSIGKLLGIGGGSSSGGSSGSSASSPSPSPSPATAPAAAPTRSVAPKPTGGSTAKPTGSTRAPKASPTPTGCAVPANFGRAAAVPAGQPRVNENPSEQIAATLSQTNLTYQGTVDLPTASGTIRAMEFTMDTSVSTPFELRVPVGSRTLSIKSSKLTVSGHVTFFTTEIKGNAEGILPLDITPDSTALLSLLQLLEALGVKDMFFTDAHVKLVFVQSDVLTADALNISYSS